MAATKRQSGERSSSGRPSTGITNTKTRSKRKLGLTSKSHVDGRKQSTLNSWIQNTVSVTNRTILPALDTHNAEGSYQSRTKELLEPLHSEPDSTISRQSNGYGEHLHESQGNEPHENEASVAHHGSSEWITLPGHEESSPHYEHFSNNHVYFSHLTEMLKRLFGRTWIEIEELLCTERRGMDKDDFDAKFHEFVDLETKTSGWQPEHIVKPSGDPSRALHLKLNYPTFRTQQLEFGESADETNNSTKLLIMKGLESNRTFWYEACFRRQKPTKSRHQSVAATWPADVLQVHTDFSNLCGALEKKVLVLFGAQNRENFRMRYRVTEQALCLSKTEVVTVGLVRDSFKNLKYIVIYCHHPEWLFWNWTIWAGRCYDACINVAAALSGVTVDPHFFENRARSIQPNPTKEICLRDADTTRKLEKLNSVLCHPDELPITVREFADSLGLQGLDLITAFNQGKSTADLIYQTIKKTEPAQSSWNRDVRMPRNLPRNIPVQTTSHSPDLQHQIRASSCPSNSSGHKTPSASQIRIVPNRTRSKNPIVMTAVVHEGREIPLMCIRCGRPPVRRPVDTKPAFCTISAAKGRYIAQRQQCNTPDCNPKGRKGQVDQFMVPQDPSIPFIRSDNLCKVQVPKTEGH